MGTNTRACRVRVVLPIAPIDQHGFSSCNGHSVKRERLRPGGCGRQCEGGAVFVLTRTQRDNYFRWHDSLPENSTLRTRQNIDVPLRRKHELRPRAF